MAKKGFKQKSRYVTAYTETDLKRDEQMFNDSLTNNTPVDWGCFKRLMVNDLCANNILETNTIGMHRIEDVQLALKYPKKGYRILMSCSDALMRISPHYYRLNSFYSNMAVFQWWLDLYDVKDNANMNTVNKTYFSLASKLESMNLKHEFSKIMKVLPYQDVYCGLIMENTTDFFIQQVDYRICKLKRVQDGLYNFAINLAAINPINIGAYPDYVQQAYISFKDGGLNNWYIPPAEKQICLKLNSQWTYPYPLLIGLVRDILDLDTYKKLKLQSARTDNYKAIMIKVPIDETTIDKPLLTPETLGVFAEINRESMTDDIGLIHTLGSAGEAISFKDSSNSRNNVADSVDDIYDSAGITKELYNGSSSGTAVTFSIENDSGYIYGVYRQFERWMNRYIKINKYNKATFKFLFYLLDATIFNRDTVTKRYKEACTLGVTVKGQYLASLDMTPARTRGSFIMETALFDFQNNFVPMATSYTQSADSETGRPTSASRGEQLSESGEQTQSSDSNSKR